MKILTVTLNPSLDQIHFVRALKRGQNQDIVRTVFSSGGKGINVSRALQDLGVAHVPMGFAGGTNGQKLLRELIVEKMEPHFVFIDGESRANITIVEEKSGKTTRFLETGPRINAKDLASFRHRYQRLVEACDWIVLSGRGIAGTPPDFYAELLQTAHVQGKKTAFDSSGQDLIRGLKAGPHVLKINQAEAESLTGKKCSAPVAVLRALLKRGARQAIITLGGGGAVGTDGDQFWKAAGPRVKALHTVGAGDSFLAGFLAASVQAQPFSVCLAAGVAAGTLGAQGIVPGRLDQAKFQNLCGKITPVLIM